MRLPTRLRERVAGLPPKVEDSIRRVTSGINERVYRAFHVSTAADLSVARAENAFLSQAEECSAALRALEDEGPSIVPFDRAKALARITASVQELAEQLEITIRPDSRPDIHAVGTEAVRSLLNASRHLSFSAAPRPEQVLSRLAAAMAEQSPDATFRNDEDLARLVEEYQVPALRPRRLRNFHYAIEQYEGRYAPHVRSLNEYVDSLREETAEWVPYLAPTYGGTSARMLALFQHTGPSAQQSGHDGASLMSLEHGDDSAARHLAYLSGAGISPGDVIAWNAYPWLTKRPPSDGELHRAAPVLTQIVSMLPALEVVVLHGVVARNAWEKAMYTFPQLRSITTVATYHTSPRVVSSENSERNRVRGARIADDLAAAAAILRRRTSQGAE